MFSMDPRGGHNRYKFKTDFFKKWTPEMAYVLGFLYADGDIEDTKKSSRTQYVKFTSKDKELLVAIKDALGCNHRINARKPFAAIYPNGKIYKNSTCYYLRIGSKKMFADLVNIGLTPRKSLTIKFPSLIPSDFLKDFIRGYFDGDGCVTIKTGIGKRGQKILKGLAVIFTSGSRDFLEGLADNANRFFGLQKKDIYFNRNAYYLKYNTKESLRLFELFYDSRNLFLKRKFDIFNRYLKLKHGGVAK